MNSMKKNDYNDKVKTLWEGHKIWKKISHLFWGLLSSVKTNGIFFQIFVAFSENLNFAILRSLK